MEVEAEFHPKTTGLRLRETSAWKLPGFSDADWGKVPCLEETAETL